MCSAVQCSAETASKASTTETVSSFCSSSGSSSSWCSRSTTTMVVAAPSKCRPSAAAAAALVVAPPSASRRRLRCRCCEDTVGVPSRRLQPKLKQQQQLAPAAAVAVAPMITTTTSTTNNVAAAAAAAATHTHPRPRRIVLVRHGESEGNVDESAYTRVPDPRIGLTARGWRHADDCGRRLRDLFSKNNGDDWKAYFYVSPYRRSLETLRGIGHAFEPHRHIAGVREEPRLREQDFGNFQDREQMKVEKEIRQRYGRFFYRFPNGESAADVYDRITGFRETLLADIDLGRLYGPPRGGSAAATATAAAAAAAAGDMNVVLVSHGLTLRVFLMRWYKWTVRQFERLENLPNGGALVMQTGEGGRYSLLVHHTADELREFGLTDEMLQDQMWQKTARPGELNHQFMTNGQSFFDPFTIIY